LFWQVLVYVEGENIYLVNNHTIILQACKYNGPEIGMDTTKYMNMA
jgi:hypothetical protein